MEKKEILYPKGIKWTKQRKDVYHVLHEAGEPLSAVQIYNRILQMGGENYAVSTIYRILTAFEENHFVEKSNFIGDGTVMYEWTGGKHTHYATCLECHKRIALKHCPFEHLHLEEDMGNFLITEHKLELYGYCKECKP